MFGADRVSGRFKAFRAERVSAHSHSDGPGEAYGSRSVDDVKQANESLTTKIQLIGFRVSSRGPLRFTGVLELIQVGFRASGAYI